jgi:mannose-6-phosphate isomerase-like protein (cupin superfamily)
MSIVRADRAPRFELNGAQFTVFAGPSNGSHEVCAWRLTLPVGIDSQPHRLNRDEVFTVLSGQARVTPGGEVLRAGDSTVVPAGQPIAVANPGDQPAELYVSIQAGFAAVTADGEFTPPWAL